MNKDNLCFGCPHMCGVNRVDTMGICNAPAELKANSAQLHYGEEPILVGAKGSGTVFFSHCNLHCCYCQNYQISALGNGLIITPEKLIETFFQLKKQGAANINLVSPTHYAKMLIPVLKEAKKEGLNLPIIWNTNSYERVETLRKLEGLVDIYLADFRYWDNANALKYSNIENYREVASAALKEMFRQVEGIKLKDGLAWQGTLIRILILPNDITGTESILTWIADNLGTDVTINLLAQYYPTFKSNEFPEINRSITYAEYQSATKVLKQLGFTNYYLQKVKPSPE